MYRLNKLWQLWNEEDINSESFDSLEVAIDACLSLYDGLLLGSVEDRSILQEYAENMGEEDEDEGNYFSDADYLPYYSEIFQLTKEDDFPFTIKFYIHWSDDGCTAPEHSFDLIFDESKVDETEIALIKKKLVNYFASIPRTVLYQIRVIEHFEDWYVASDEGEYFYKLEHAIKALIKLCYEVYINNETGLKGYIEENLEPCSYEEEYGDCSCGFEFMIDEDIHISLKYDYLTDSIEDPTKQVISIYLGLAPISSITEPAWISGRVGVANMLRGTPTLAEHVLKEMKRTIFTGRVGKEADMSFGRRLINALGMATNPREAEKLNKMFAGDKNVYLNSYFRGPAGLFLTQYTNFIRVWTATAGLKMIQSHANRINKLKGHELAGWKNELRENGMSEDDFRQMIRLAPKGKIDILNDEYMDTRFTKTDGTEVSIKDTLLPWVRKITTDIALEPGVDNRPLWMSDPNWELVSQLKSFPILFGNTVMKRTMRQIDPKVCTPTVVAGVGAIGSAATALALAALALAIKDEIKDVDSAEDDEYDIEIDKFWNAAWGEPSELTEETFDLILRSTIVYMFAEEVTDV